MRDKEAFELIKYESNIKQDLKIFDEFLEYLEFNKYNNIFDDKLFHVKGVKDNKTLSLIHNTKDVYYCMDLRSKNIKYYTIKFIWKENHFEDFTDGEFIGYTTEDVIKFFYSKVEEEYGIMS